MKGVWKSDLIMATWNMEGRLFTGRRNGRPRERWMDDVVADLKVMKIKQWTEKVKEKEKWKLLVEETKAHTRAVAPRGRKDYTGCHFMLFKSELHTPIYTGCYFRLLKSEFHIANYTECYFMSHFK